MTKIWASKFLQNSNSISKFLKVCIWKIKYGNKKMFKYLNKIFNYYKNNFNNEIT